VLATHELGESDLIVAFLARDHGKVRGVARGARASRRRFGGLLEPLTQVRVAWTEREGSDLHRVEDLDAVRSFAAMQRDPALQAACAVLCELVESFSHEGQAEQTAFRLLVAVLEALEAGRDPWTIFRYFEYWTLRIHGLLPRWDGCASCGRPAPRGRGLRIHEDGVVRCVRCDDAAPGPGRPLGRVTVAFLSDAGRLGPAEIEAEPGTVAPGGTLERLLRGTLEAFAERRFRTYRHLRAATALRTSEGAAP